MRILSIIVGAVFVFYIGHGLHSNPRWTWSPGEGEVPRDVVAMYMDLAYKQGKVDEAAKTFFSPKTKDNVSGANILPGGKAFEPAILQVIAEGFNVAVHYKVKPEAGAAAEYVEIYNVKGGRITSRERIVAAPSTPATPSGSAAAEAAPAQSTNRQ
ncbi:hypothetical protein [Eoetvoesiella caeni]